MSTTIISARTVVSAFDLPPAQGLSYVLPIHVYNLPLFESFLVIDIRGAEEHEHSHIATSVNLPMNLIAALTNADRDKFLAHALEIFVGKFGMPERMSPIVLYGDSSLVGLETLHWLAKRLLSLSDDPLPINKSVKNFYKSLSTNQRVWILEGGLPAFSAEFPLLINPTENGTEAGTMSLPFMMVPGLFLGSRSVNSLERRLEGRLALDLDTLRALGITHVIMNGSVSVSPEDTFGIHCLNCDVPDNNEADLLSVWPLMIKFIETARNSNSNVATTTTAMTTATTTATTTTTSTMMNTSDSTALVTTTTNFSAPINQQHQSATRVLVQFHGRSRSAGVIAAWAIHVLKISAEQAVKFVCDRCFYTLDRSLMNIDQLKLFEKQQKEPQQQQLKLLQ